MEYAVIGLGSNKSFSYTDEKSGKSFLMTPLQILGGAVTSLKKLLVKTNISSVYESKAMYYADQENFYNMVLTGYYEGSPFELLEGLHLIEEKFGRNRKKEIRNGPRSLDLDIELFGHIKVCEENLIIPHERLLERSFVLTPLVEVLNSNADVFSEDLEFYRKKKELLKNQEIKLFMTSYDFEKNFFSV